MVTFSMENGLFLIKDGSKLFFPIRPWVRLDHEEKIYLTGGKISGKKGKLYGLRLSHPV